MEGQWVCSHNHERNVIFTNETREFAVGFEYVKGTRKAPIVSLIAEGEVCKKRMKKIEKEQTIDVVESGSFAAILASISEIEEEIPRELYEGVALELAKYFNEKERQEKDSYLQDSIELVYLFGNINNNKSFDIVYSIHAGYVL